MPDRIGFIGLGIMGKPMTRNLLKAGYPVVVYNRSRAPIEELVSEGAQAGVSPLDVASRSDVIILMLPDSPVVESVVTGQDGLLDGLGPGKVVIDMSTISPDTARRMAALVQEKGGA